MRWLLQQSASVREQVVEMLDEPSRLAALEWLSQVERQARPAQLEPPGDWFVWLVRSGRGWGKTQTGAWFLRRRIDSCMWTRCIAAGPTAADVRDTMIEGPSGLLHAWPEHLRPTWEPTKRKLTAHNGAVILTVSADDPDRFRGMQADGAWADEIDSWPRMDSWDTLTFSVRLGPDPRIVATSTPKRSRLVRKLALDPRCCITAGSTYDNSANLSPSFLAQIKARYEGTHLGRQEIHGELIDEVEGAIVSHELIDAHRIGGDAVPVLRRVVVGVDPSGSAKGDEQGIVAVGIAADGHLYVLRDASCRSTPDGWGRRAVELYHELDADRLVLETNYGGDMAEAVIRKLDPQVNLRRVHASRGKAVRFEPVGMLYEQGRVHHVGTFDVMEDQLCSFSALGYQGDESPDRADALVWAVTDLALANRWGFEHLYQPEAA